MSLDDHIAQARANLLAAAAQAGGPLVMAYSAGKDSIVACHLAKEVLGLTAAVCDNSFWFVRHQADAQRTAAQIGIKVAYRDRFGWRYLLRHPDWMFRADSKMAPLYGQRQQSTVKNYAKREGFAGAIYGRRTEENMVPSPCYQTKDGIWQIHPLRDWKTDHIWQYIARYNLHVPAIYSSEVGRQDGSTPAIFLDPAKYSRPVDLVIQGFCPETYALMKALDLFTLYRKHNGRYHSAPA
jgi:3'-phosphoadenosine 5'-phosphosulfate sulfotransferase (PAPS reductase)/FAD synthetase